MSDDRVGDIFHLPARTTYSHPRPMFFCVTEAEPAMIRTALEQCGELSAAVELRRLFRAIADIRQARECVRIIARWRPIPAVD